MVAGHRGGALGRLVVGVGVDGQQAQGVGHRPHGIRSGPRRERGPTRAHAAAFWPRPSPMLRGAPGAPAEPRGGDRPTMGVFKRFVDILRAKANKLLDRVEDPATRSISPTRSRSRTSRSCGAASPTVATARKRIEIQANQLRQRAAKLQRQARDALGQDREDLAREALTRRAAIEAQVDRPRRPAGPDRRPGGPRWGPPSVASAPGVLLPHPQGHAQGHLQRGRSPDPRGRGRGGHLGVDERHRGRPRPGYPTRSPRPRRAPAPSTSSSPRGALPQLAHLHRRHPGPAGPGRRPRSGRARARRPAGRAGGAAAGPAWAVTGAAPRAGGDRRRRSPVAPPSHPRYPTLPKR